MIELPWSSVMIATADPMRQVTLYRCNGLSVEVSDYELVAVPVHPRDISERVATSLIDQAKAALSALVDWGVH